MIIPLKFPARITSKVVTKLPLITSIRRNHLKSPKHQTHVTASISLQFKLIPRCILQSIHVITFNELGV